MRSFSILLAAVVAAFSAVCAFSSDASALPALDDISAKSAVVINADTGGIVYEKDAFSQRAMASTTKIMTALITLEAGDLDTPFIADSMAIKVEGTSMGLREGDTVTRRALVCGMLLPSGNDAANAAAVNIAGSLSAFADMMNERAQRIGMNDTHFVNPSGLDAKGHHTTAYDMALLTREALKNEDFREICGRRMVSVSFGDPPKKRTLYNSNKLLRMYDGCIGVKTGFTDNARRCLVSAAVRDGVTVIAVTLDAPDDWNDHKKLLDTGFERIRPVKVRINSFSAEAVGGSPDTVTISPDSGITLGLTEEEARTVSVKYSVPGFVYAPVEKGETLGFADVYVKDSFVKRIPMKAYDAAERAVPSPSVFERFVQLFTG